MACMLFTTCHVKLCRCCSLLFLSPCMVAASPLLLVSCCCCRYPYAHHFLFQHQCSCFCPISVSIYHHSPLLAAMLPLVCNQQVGLAGCILIMTSAATAAAQPPCCCLQDKLLARLPRTNGTPCKASREKTSAVGRHCNLMHTV